MAIKSNKTAKSVKFHKSYLLISGLLLMLSLNFDFLADFLSPGLPAGMDGSGHFALSLLYFNNHWPAIDGRLEAYFQGFYFPRFYPPLFYIFAGYLYHLFPNVENELLIKLLVTFNVIVIPGLIGILTRNLGKSFLQSITAVFISGLLLSSGDQFSNMMMGLKEAIHTGLYTQNLGAVMLILTLLLIFSEIKPLLKAALISLVGTGLMLSNLHTVFLAGLLLTAYLIIYIIKYRSAEWQIVVGLFLSVIIASPWYIKVFIHRDESPAIPIEIFGNSNLFFSYTAIFSVLANLIVVLFSKYSNTKIYIFCLSSLIAIPIIIYLPQLLPFRIPWQPNRLIMGVNLFLPVFIVQAYDSIKKFAEEHAIWLRPRIFCSAIVGLLSMFCIINPVSGSYGKLSAYQSKSISDVTEWISKNPSNGYTSILFRGSPDGNSNSFDVALSHYIPLTGSRGLWSVFRESSYNSIFATALRNMLSENQENYGIPNYLKSEDFNKIPLKKKLHILPSWGVDTLIFDSSMNKKFISRSGLLEIKYSKDGIAVARLKKDPIISFNSDKAILFISKPISYKEQKHILDFGKLGQKLITDTNNLPPILLFRSCEDLYSRIGQSDWNISCSEKLPCCKNILNTIYDFNNVKLHNSLNINVENKTPDYPKDLVAAPWRKATLLENTENQD